jgi:hypothetical protein
MPTQFITPIITPNPPILFNPAIELIVGMQTSILSKIVPNDTSERGMIYCKLLFRGMTAYNYRHRMKPVNPEEIKEGLLLVARSAACRFQSTYGNGGNSDISLINGIPPDEVNSSRSPVNTMLDEYCLNFFCQSFNKFFVV